ELPRLDVSGVPDGPGGQVPRALITPPTNPLSAADSNARLVWAYGMRNPWRFGIDQVTGALYAVDVGESSFEELNEVLPGDFLGWPYREGPDILSVPPCPEPGGARANDYKGPIVAVPHARPGQSAIVTTGMYRPVPGGSDNWPVNYHGYYGDVFYGDYYAGYLRRLKKLSGVWGAPPAAPGQPDAQDWATGLTSAVEFLVGPDGSLWWMSQFDSTWGGATGRLQRIRWTGATLAVGGNGASHHAALEVAPNPFRLATRVALHLPSRERVTVALYDVAGHGVRELCGGEATAEVRDPGWAGRAAPGEPAAPGLYFARLTGAGVAPSTATVLRLR